jgi:hypothetical protein
VVSTENIKKSTGHQTCNRVSGRSAAWSRDRFLRLVFQTKLGDLARTPFADETVGRACERGKDRRIKRIIAVGCSSSASPFRPYAGQTVRKDTQDIKDYKADIKGDRKDGDKAYAEGRRTRLTQDEKDRHQDKKDARRDARDVKRDRASRRHGGK